MTFSSLGLPAPILKAIDALGFTEPTPVQEQTIPVLLEGDGDLVALAQTGTGKTAAFGLPMLAQIEVMDLTPQALILSPTRELAVQITSDLQSYGKFLPGLRVISVYGGASIQTQIRELQKGCHIIVATPGRMVDLLSRKNIMDISQIRTVVLDEADVMLNMGFKEDLNRILSETPAEKRSWMFSATMPQDVARIAKKYMNNPVEITTGTKNTGNENIEHEFYMVHARDKYAALKRIADFYPEIFGIVFCRTKIETQQIAKALIDDGYNADAIHGDLTQAQRDNVMGRFRNRSIQMLVATDVAARGIDVDNVTHVVNYGLPDEPENYTHRSGRTARAGKSGICISIIHMHEKGKIQHIEKRTGKRFQQKQVPGAFEVCGKQLVALMNKVREVKVNSEDIAPFMPHIEAALEGLSREEIIQRFVSVEFNHFLDYYRNTPDLNIHQGGTRGGREEQRGGRSGGTVKFFINLGERDGLDAPALKHLLSVAGQVDQSDIVWTDLRNNYSFFEVRPEQASTLMRNAKSGHTFMDRKVVIEQRDRQSNDRGPRERTRRPASGGGNRGGKKHDRKRW